MGRIKPGIIGEVSGKAGYIVFRKVNGKIFFSLRPGKYKTGKSKPAKANRTNFGACVKFASFLNKDPFIHKIWEQRKLKGSSSYNRLIKYNSGKFKTLFLHY